MMGLGALSCIGFPHFSPQAWSEGAGDQQGGTLYWCTQFSSKRGPGTARAEMGRRKRVSMQPLQPDQTARGGAIWSQARQELTCFPFFPPQGPTGVTGPKGGRGAQGPPVSTTGIRQHFGEGQPGLTPCWGC